MWAAGKIHPLSYSRYPSWWHLSCAGLSSCCTMSWWFQKSAVSSTSQLGIQLGYPRSPASCWYLPWLVSGGVTSQFFRHQGKKDIRNGPSHTNVRAQDGRLKESLCFDLLRDWLIGMSSSGQMQVYNMYLSKCHRTVHSGSFWSSQNTKTREIWLFYVHTHLPYTPQKASNSQLWNFYPIFLASIVQLIARLCQENIKQVRKCMHKTFTERHYSWRQNQLFHKPSQHLQRHKNTTLARAKLSSANPQQLNTIFHQKMAHQKDRRGDMLC